MIYEGEHGGFHSKQTKARTDGKKGRRSDQDFTEALISLSELGLIPWDDIVDETREVHSWNSYSTILQGLEARLEYARLDPWFGASQRPIILCEARTIGGVFSRTIGPEYLVDIASTGGQCKRFLITKVAPLLGQYDEDLIVLYGGDHDDAGGDIEDNTRRILKEYCHRPFDWLRVAITDEQCEALKAQGVQPIVKRDGRYRDGRTHLAYEAEALGQGYITQIFRENLDQLLPEPLRAVLVREARERKALAAKLKSWRRK
jgi:hypothetical protein